MPFYPGNPNYSLRESCRGIILDPINTDWEKQEPRLLFVTVDVESGDTISFDSYDTKTKYDEYNENDEQEKEDNNKRDDQYKHLIRYPKGIEWKQLCTTFSMPDLYRYATIEDESSVHDKDEKNRTYWDGGVSSNTPLRELISKHKEYWKRKGQEIRRGGGEGEEGAVVAAAKTQIPSLNVYIADVWPAKIKEYPIPSDNDFVASRKANLLLMDKTEYEESVTKMITDYRDLMDKIIENIKDPQMQAKINKILDNGFTKSTIHTNNKKTYRQLLLEDKFDIDRVMRIERKDDTFAVGLAMADFSAHTISQLLASGRFDALDKLINTLTFTVQNLKEKELEKVPTEVKDRLYNHLREARNLLGSEADDQYNYKEVMNHLYDFVDEVNTMENKFGKDIEYGVIDLLRP